MKNSSRVVSTLLISVIIASTLQAMNENQVATIESFNAQRDLKAVKNILMDNYKTILVHPDYLNEEQIGARTGYFMDNLILNPADQVAVMRVDEQMIGLVHYCVRKESILTFHLEKYGAIGFVGVESAHQKQGHGTRLLQHAVQELEQQKVPSIKLIVPVNNTDARQFFEQRGFTHKELVYGMTAIIYHKTYNIPADQLPQGNWIQRLINGLAKKN